jgi:hypothetical protein
MTVTFCPIDPQKAGFVPSQKLRQKVPLVERAAEAARNRAISLAQASVGRFSNDFALNGNAFHLFRRGGSFGPDGLIELIISHLGSIFHDLSIGIYLNLDRGNITFVTINVFPLGAQIPRGRYTPLSQTAKLFELEFAIEGNEIKMDYLASEIMGKGGEALLALYSIAQGLMIKTIIYAVHKPSVNVKQFYMNFGFGEPINEACTHWQVKVKK